MRCNLLYKKVSASSRLTAGARGNDTTEGANGHETVMDSEASYNLATTGNGERENGERGKGTIVQLESVVGIGLEACRAAGGRNTACFT